MSTQVAELLQSREPMAVPAILPPAMVLACELKQQVGLEPLAPADLEQLQKEERDDVLGNAILPLVRSVADECAGKITGMLLDLEVACHPNSDPALVCCSSLA